MYLSLLDDVQTRGGCRGGISGDGKRPELPSAGLRQTTRGLRSWTQSRKTIEEPLKNSTWRTWKRSASRHFPEASGPGNPGFLLCARTCKSILGAELIELLLELAETHDEVRRSLEDRRNLTSGQTHKVLKKIRSEIAALAEPVWDSDDYGFQSASTGRLKAMLQALVAAGQVDAAVRLGPELLAAGSRAMEYEHGGESSDAISACLNVLFRALDGTSLSPADRMEWALDMALADDCELCYEGLESLLGERTMRRSDWSAVCDRLTQRLDARGQPPRDDELSRDYKRDLIADWLIHALEKAGRRNEIIPLCKREAPITFSYNRLVDRLIAERAWDEARHWCRQGFEANPDRFAGLHAALREQLQTINLRSGNPLAGLAIQAEEFFARPSSEDFQALCNAARGAGRWRGRRGVGPALSANRPAPSQHQETQERPGDGMATARSGSRNAGAARQKKGAYGRRG